MSATESIDELHHVLSTEGKQLASQALARLLPVGTANNDIAQSLLYFLHGDYFSSVYHLLDMGFSTKDPLVVDFARLVLTDAGLRDLGFPDDALLSVAVYNHHKADETPCANCGAESTDFDGHDQLYDENQQAWTNVTTQKCPSCGAHTHLVFTLNKIEVEKNP